jgi:hypothetical protein
VCVPVVVRVSSSMCRCRGTCTRQKGHEQTAGNASNMPAPHAAREGQVRHSSAKQHGEPASAAAHQLGCVLLLELALLVSADLLLVLLL